MAIQVYAIGEYYGWKPLPKTQEMNALLGKLYPHLQEEMMRYYLGSRRMGEADKHLKLSAYVDNCYDAWAKHDHEKKRKHID